MARPRPKPSSPPVALPRWKRSKISSRSSAGTPGAGVGDLHRRPLAVVGGDDADRLVRRARSAARCRAGCGRSARPRPGRPSPSTGRSAGRRRCCSPRSAARGSNSAATARVSSPSSTGSERSGASASSRERSSRSEARCSRRRSWRLAPAICACASSRSTRPSREVVVEQLEHPLQQRERGAQLVRRGGDERAPRVLLADRATPASWPARGRGRRPRRARRRAAAARRGRSLVIRSADWRRRSSRRSSARRQRAAQHERDDEPDERRGEERRAHLVDRLADVGQRLRRDQRADDLAARPVVERHRRRGRRPSSRS